MKKIFLLTVILLAYSSAYASEPFKITFGPYLQNLTENEVTIIWGTSGDALSWVETAPNDDTHFYAEDRPKFYETSMGKRKVGRLHRVTLKGLEPATDYRYRVCSHEVTEMEPYKVSYGSTVSSDVYRRQPYCFTTVDPGKTELSFVVVNDIHERSEHLGNLLSSGNVNDRDFVFYNGDMVDNMNSESQLIEGFLSKSTELFATEIPFYFARGNHETRGTFSERYLDYFPAPTGTTYYSFRRGPVFFIVLDGGEDKPDSDIEYYGLSDFDTFRAEQVGWLQETVNSNECRTAPFKIVMIHVPPIIENNSWHGTLEANRHFMPILNNAGVDLMLCGHLHKHIYYPARSSYQFPVIINSNENAVDISATHTEMRVIIRNSANEIKERFSLKAKD